MRRFIVSLCLLMVLLLTIGTTVLAQQQAGEVSHVVQRGENLFRISLRYNVSMAAIAQRNGIANINVIYVGQVLIIPAGGTTPPPATTQPPPQPGPSTYTVQRGDTLGNIARRFNTTIQILIQLNPQIINPNLIYPGQVINLPGGTGTVPTPVNTPTSPIAGGQDRPSAMPALTRPRPRRAIPGYAEPTSRGESKLPVLTPR